MIPTTKKSLWSSVLAVTLSAGALGATLFPTAANAQTVTGELDGTVRDPQGAVVPNATVVVTNSDQNQVVRTVKTDALGQFTAPLLAVGSYSVKITAPGFRETTLKNLNVHVGQPTGVPVELTVGSNSEVVNVDAAQQAIQLDSAAAGTLIDKEQTTQLPLANRNYLQLMSIQPGISGPVPGENPRGNIKSSGAVNTQQYSVNGNATSTNGYYLDGADTLKRAGQQPVTFPSVDFVQEINLQRGSYGADIGGPGAASVNVQTKSGATAFHGGAFAFFRSQIFNANAPGNKLSNVARPETRSNDTGYYIGGPIWIPGKTSRATAKTFFFFGQEYLRQLDGYPVSISNIPTLAQRGGTFSSPVCPTNSACTTATAVSQISSIDPVSAAYLADLINFVPVPNNPGDVQGLNVNETGTNNETQTLIRIDRQFTSKLSGFFRYLDDPFHLTVPFGFQQVSMIPGVATALMTNGSTSWLGHATYVLGTNHVFEGGYSQRSNWVTAVDVGRIANANSPDVHINLPYTNVLDHVPNLTIGGSNYKGSGIYNERSPERQIFLNNTNTWGRHTIEAGINVELQVSFSNSAGANAGNFTFAATPVPTDPTTGKAIPGTSQFAQAFSDFLRGKSTQFTQANVDIDSALQSNIYEGFVQDNVHITPRLTLLGGVRYTFFSPYSNAVYQNQPFHPAQNFFVPAYNASQAPTLDQTGNICTASPCGTSGRTPNANYNPTNGIIIAGVNSPFGNSAGQPRVNNFSPRVGFTYDVFGDGRTALRGGFGVYYDQVIGNTAKFATNQDPPNVTTATVTNPATFASPGNGSAAAPQSLQAYDPLGKQAYTMQYSLDLQQQISPAISIDLGYYGNEGRHQTANIDLNQPAPGAYVNALGGTTTTGGVTNPTVITAGNTGILNQVRPYQNWSFITQVAGMFKSNYNSLQSTLRLHTRKGAQFLVNYTFSRALTNARSPQCNCNLRVEYGPTDLDRDDIFNAAIVYPLPFLVENHHWYAYAAGGWQVSGIVTYGSGQFLTVSQSGVDPAGLGLQVGPSTARPDQLFDPNIAAPRQRYNVQGTWFNKAAFGSVPANTVRPGNAPVADIRGPGYEVWNLSVYKNFSLPEGLKFQLRAESFNTFNHPNPNAVSTTLGATNFGQVTGYGDPRRMQFGAKLTF